MRTVFLLILLAVAILISRAARGEDGEIPARVLCDGGRLAAIQIYVAEPGVITLEIPRDVCGRAA